MDMTTTFHGLNSERDKRHWEAFAVILLAALALRVAAFQGYVDSDPHEYAVLANDLANGILHIPNYNGAPVFPLRVATYAPTAAAIRMFGLSEVTLAAYPFVISIASCVLVYILARLFVSPLAGLISLAILAVLPSEVAMASMLYPDAIAAFWAGIGVLLSVLAVRSDRSKGSAGYGLAAGLCFGISWLAKEPVVFLAPFVALSMLVLAREAPIRTRTISLVCVGLGSLAVLGAEVVFFHLVADDALFRFHEVERNFQENKVWFFHQSSPYFGWESGGYVRAVIKRLFKDGPIFLLTGFGGLPALAVVALAWGVIFRNRTFMIAGVWFATLFVLFNFGSTSLTQYLPLTFSAERYLYPLLLPSVILVGALLATLLLPPAQLSVYKERAFWALVIILAFLSISVIRFPRSQPEAVAKTVAGRLRPTDLVYTDFRTARTLVFFRNRQLGLSTSTTLPWEQLSPVALKTGDYVLIHREKLAFIQNAYGYKPPEFVSAPPSAWTSVWRRNGATLFRVVASPPLQAVGQE